MIGDRIRKAVAGQDSSGSMIPGVDHLRLSFKGNSQAVARANEAMRGSGNSGYELPSQRSQQCSGYSTPSPAAGGSILGSLGIGNNIKMLLAPRLYGKKIATVKLVRKGSTVTHTMTKQGQDPKKVHVPVVTWGDYGTLDLYRRDDSFTAIVSSGPVKGIYPLMTVMFQENFKGTWYIPTTGEVDGHNVEATITDLGMVSNTRAPMVVGVEIKVIDAPGTEDDVDSITVAAGNGTDYTHAKSTADKQSAMNKLIVYGGWGGKDAKKAIAAEKENDDISLKAYADAKTQGWSGYTIGRRMKQDTYVPASQR